MLPSASKADPLHHLGPVVIWSPIIWVAIPAGHYKISYSGRKLFLPCRPASYLSTLGGGYNLQVGEGTAKLSKIF